MPEASVRPSVNHYSKATPEEKAAVEEVAARALAFEAGIGRDFRERCEKFYRQYRGFRKFRDAWTQAGPNDRDGVLYDAKRQWGAHLHIPLSYRTIETKVPRAIAHRPRLLYLPRKERWAENVQNVQLLIDAQQDNIDIDLPFQMVMRAGMMYGVGFGKSFWRKEYARRRRVKQRLFVPGKYVVGKPQMECTFDDPDFEDLDVFDVFWDPFGSSVKTCGWMLHRTWLPLEACMQRVQSGAWNTASAKALTEEELRRMGGGQEYDEIWNARMEASGFSSVRDAARGEQIHEVWEWHDGERVLTVLDRQVLVQDAENPCFGSLPFHAYRPTPLAKQMVGIGELEPIEHLQRELDTMRSQQRDAATIALCAGYAYDSMSVNEEDLVFGPASAIEVRNARPSDAIMPLPVRDLPNSSYQEQQIVRSDIDLVAGLNDQDAQGDVTATEAQLVQAGLSRRIELQSRRFEIEVVRGVARNFLHLNQRMILEDREAMPVPEDGEDAETAAREGRYRWVQMGPVELQGEFHIVPEGGSMAAENIPQMRQDAMQIMQNFGQNPYIDQRQPLLKALQLFGIRDGQSWLKQTDPPVPPLALEILSRVVDPQVIKRAVEAAQQQDPRLAQGPGVEQVNQMMGEEAA